MQQITAQVGAAAVLADGPDTHIRFGPLVLTMSHADARALAGDIIAASVVDRAIKTAIAGNDSEATRAEAAKLRAQLRADFAGPMTEVVDGVGQVVE